MENEPAIQWVADLDQLIFRGSRLMDEVVFFGVAESGDDFTKFSTISQWFQTLIHPLIQQRLFSPRKSSTLILTVLIKNFELEKVSKRFGLLTKLVGIADPNGVAVRSNHGVWFPLGQSVRENKWCKFERTFSNQKSETRYIREIIYGKKRVITYWEITNDPETMPENSTSFVMTNLQGSLKKTLGNLYGLRTWVEYAFSQCKQELGWTDYRFTNFQHIERWWEIIFCVYTMISLNSPRLLAG
ncbi:Mobile element protein [Richelia intracellularis]|nr:Mobile element protein [Richelia intracellularis]